MSQDTLAVLQAALAKLEDETMETKATSNLRTLIASLEAAEPVATFDVAVNERTAAIHYDMKHKLKSGDKLYTQAQPVEQPVPQSDDELHGMWSRSDFEGGPYDCVQPVAQKGCMRCNTPNKCAIHGCSPLTWPAEITAPRHQNGATK